MHQQNQRMASSELSCDSFRRISTFTVFIFFLLKSVSGRSQLTLRYKTLEELPIGTVIADDVIENVALRHGYSNETAQTLTLSIIDGWTDFISLGIETKQRNSLLVKERLDRELICPSMRSLTDGQDCVVSVDVAIHPVQYFQVIRIEVIIIDINDNSPVYSHSDFYQSIPESVPPGTYIRLPAAVDLDLSPYSISRYHLESAHPGDHPFRLVWNMTSSGSLYEHDDVRLELMGALDRETVAAYRLTIRAYDGDTHGSQRSALLRVVIDVSDVNDNSPAFELDSYDVTLSNDCVGGMVVVRVVANDSDEGRNGIVRYKLSKRSQALAGDLFNIHHVTGDVTLVRGFDQKALLSTAEHKLVVIATDQGDNPLPTSVVVTIRAPENLKLAGSNGLNDKHTAQRRKTLLINVETLDGNNLTSHIIENNPPGAFLAHITAAVNTAGSNNYDEEENGDVTCSIFSHTCTTDESATSGDFFSIQPLYGRLDFKLVAISSLDRERCSAYDVIVSCKTTSRMTSSAVVKVMIDDVDDNSPVFEKEIYQIQMKENNDVGDLIVVVLAHDEDILDQEQKKRVERDSGSSKHLLKSPGMKTSRSENGKNRTIKASKDHNEKTHYKHSSHEAKLNYFNEQHNLESNFNQRPNYRVRRNKNSKEVVQKVTAALYYKLDYEGSKYFRINSKTGEIFALISFDREARSRYQFSVTALTIYHEINQDKPAGFLLSDEALQRFSGNGNTTARCLVRITILDEDDEKAQFVRSWYRFSVSEAAGSGTEVGTVKAVDNDQTQNAQFRYQLAIGEGNEASQFAIDPNSGVIYTRRQLDRESISHYTLKVKAVKTTTASNHEDDSTLVFIKILDSNDNPPVFIYPSPDTGSVWRLAGESGRDAVVVTVRDPDEGENARISFHLVSGSDDRNLFQVEETSGVLTWTDLSYQQIIPSHSNSDTESSLSRSSRSYSSVKSTSKFSTVSSQSHSSSYSSSHSTLPISSFHSSPYHTYVNKSHCPMMVTLRATDHPTTEQSLSTTGVLFVLPRGCNWSPASRALISDVSMTSFDSGAETLTKFHILIIAGAVGMCIVLSILLGISVCLCRYCRKSASSPLPEKDAETVSREVELVTNKKNNNDENDSDDDEKREAFLMLDKLCREGESDKQREIVLYVKDPTGLKGPEPVARFQLHPVPDCRRSSRLYSSRRSRSRAESDESDLFRADRDTDSGYLDVSSV